MDTLVETMRYVKNKSTFLKCHQCLRSTEIADCSQHAYQVLPLADAAKLMFFSNPAELLNFCAEVRLTNFPVFFFFNLYCYFKRNWHVDQAQGAIIFQTDSLQKSRNVRGTMKLQQIVSNYFLFSIRTSLPSRSSKTCCSTPRSLSASSKH